MMQDSHGRSIRYLRLSISRACGMRCIYCRPEGCGPLDDDAPLTPLETEQLARHLITRHGLRKLRLTGGEPTARGDLIEIVERLAALPLEDLGLTTNGLTLERDAMRLRRAGLRRINISLDSLDRERFVRIAGTDKLDHVVAGIHAAVAAGLSPVKLNTVVIRGENDGELGDLATFAASIGAQIRFIELMPMGPLAAQWGERYVAEAEMRERLGTVVAGWTPLPCTSGSARGSVAHLSCGRAVTIGFISPMSHPFCGACDRIRIATDGAFYPCLMDRPGANLLPAIRPRLCPGRLDELLLGGLGRKADEHPASGYSPMIQLGG